MFLILCCFLFPGLCGGCLCSEGSSGIASVDFVLHDVSISTLCFLFPSVFGGCGCSGVSSGTSGVDCVLDNVSKTMLFFSLVCVAAVCAVVVLVELVA